MTPKPPGLALAVWLVTAIKTRQSPAIQSVSPHPAQPHRQHQAQHQHHAGQENLAEQGFDRNLPQGLGVGGRRRRARHLGCDQRHPERRGDKRHQRGKAAAQNQRPAFQRQFWHLGGKQAQQTGAAEQRHQARLMQSAHESEKADHGRTREMQTAFQPVGVMADRMPAHDIIARLQMARRQGDHAAADLDRLAREIAAVLVHQQRAGKSRLQRFAESEHDMRRAFDMRAFRRLRFDQAGMGEGRRLAIQARSSRADNDRLFILVPGWSRSSRPRASSPASHRARIQAEVSCGVVKNDPQSIALSRGQRADAVPVIDGVGASLAFDRAAMDREDHAVALVQRNHAGAGLGIWAAARSSRIRRP